MSAVDNSTYWIVAIPNHAHTGRAHSTARTEEQTTDDMKQTRRQLDMKTARLSANFDFGIPKLRVGTLDALMALSDEVGRIDTQIESLVKKIERTHKDLTEGAELRVEDNTPYGYVQSFRWDAAKFPVGANLSQLTTKIQQDAAAIDEEMRKRTARYTEIQQALAGIERKESGTLLVKPLTEIVNPKDLLSESEHEYLTSLLVVVPKQKEKDFLERYETMEDRAAESEKKAEDDKSNRQDGKEKPALSPEEQAEEKKRVEREERARRIRSVVPRSAKLLYQDGEFALYRIIILKKGEETIKNLCRLERYTVRQYQHDPNQAEVDKQSKNELMQDKTKTLGTLKVWTETSYSDTFVAWIHLKAIRVFVESVLRYGIPVNFQAVLIKPEKGVRPKLRKVLQDTYGFLAGRDLTSSEEDKGAEALIGVGSEFYPYVYLTVTLDEEVH